MTKIFLVRHGVTEFNQSLRLQGSSDIPLNASGIDQAKKAREFFKDENIEIMLSSPLSRAYKTAEIINEHHNLDIKVFDELKEQYFGPLEGEHIENIRLRYPQGDLPGAESFKSLTGRTRRMMAYIEEHHMGKNVMVTAHSRTIKSFLSMYTGEVHMVLTKLDNCSLSMIEHHDDDWIVTAYNINTQN
ncbi:histidine phosphatase family protein [Lacicoccus alkaliphilus]|uniref:Uncharacterized phosphatase n=1 Tax=Lacicoccus alkaliphilus DSM 16010 TaxID=1123231 RepID=A0A1M7AJR9_9BACL|nr:histidine phosphatase family protein [Salinicoccus alkaliphilus]SHL42895.1 uncharacterized phosphatase [Salinicoccus alkaliphilus DSM 16010]